MHSPVYAQIAGVLTRRITTGMYSVGEQIPALEKLISEFSASRMTVVKSLDKLAEQGLIIRRHGVGTFVAETPKPEHAVIHEANGEIELDGGRRSSRLTGSKPWSGPDPATGEDGIPPDNYQYMSRNMYLGGEIYHTVEYFLDADVYSLKSPDFWVEQTMVRALVRMKENQPLSVRQIVKIDTADIAEANELNIELNTSVVHVRRTFANKETGRLICIALMVFRADMVQFDTTIDFTSESMVPNIQGIIRDS